MKEKNQGITLIALIITIIILLILATISVNIVIKGDLFGKAGEAVDKTNDKVAQEQSRVDELMGELEYVESKQQGHDWQYIDNTLAQLKCICGVCKRKNVAGVIYSIGQEIPYTAGPTGTKWVVFGAEDCDKNGTNETLLITTLEPSEETLHLEGADAYNNGIAKIEAKVKEIYGNEARAMTIEDINRTLGYTPAGGMYYDENNELQTTGNLTTKLKDLGTTWTRIVEYNTNNKGGVFYTPAHPEGISDNGAELGEYVLDGYSYEYIDVPSTTSIIPKKLVFGISNAADYNYWLACRGVFADSDWAMSFPFVP